MGSNLIGTTSSRPLLSICFTISLSCRIHKPQLSALLAFQRPRGTLSIEIPQDLETAKTLRENEKKDFDAAKAEMEQGVADLDSAIKTMLGWFGTGFQTFFDCGVFV